MLDVGNKQCTKCKEIKSLVEFSKDFTRQNGLQSHCKACVTAYSKEHYQRNKKRISEKCRIKYQEGSLHFWRVKLGSMQLAKQFAKKYDKDPNCYYCRKFLHATETHVDHLTPKSRGGLHSIENLAVACADCNQLKHTRTEIEFRVFLTDYLTRFVGNEAEAGAVISAGHRVRLSELAPEKGDATVCSHMEMNRERLAEMTSPAIH